MRTPVDSRQPSQHEPNTLTHRTAVQTAERLQVCEHTIRRMAKRGELPYIRVGLTGRLIRFRLEDIEAYESRNQFNH